MFGIGSLFKLTRELKGLTEKELAELTGLAQSTISQIENGKRKPRGKTLTKLAEALEIPQDDLQDVIKQQFSIEENVNESFYNVFNETINKYQKAKESIDELKNEDEINEKFKQIQNMLMDSLIDEIASGIFKFTIESLQNYDDFENIRLIILRKLHEKLGEYLDNSKNNN